jgi:chloramphenicol O-acetyltransferase type B
MELYESVSTIIFRKSQETIQATASSRKVSSALPLPEIHDWREGSTLRIGRYCSIAGNVQIFLGGLHRTDWISTFPFPAFIEEAAGIEDYDGTRGDVEIGNDVWLCSGCTILSGVTIGDGAVVACGSIVTRDVEPYSVVAGNPARHVRWRFPEEQRQALLEIPGGIGRNRRSE